MYVLMASDERMEPEAESKAEAVDSKRALDWKRKKLGPIALPNMLTQFVLSKD